MTLIDTATGEIVAPMTKDEAIEITSKIVALLEEAWPLVKEAYQRRAWVALDYASWDAYCKEEFGTDRFKLPASKRLEVVADLRSAGMSTRAIASATGVAQDTVNRDLKRGERFRSPDPDDEIDEPVSITGIDGKSYRSRPKATPPTVSKEFDDFLLGRLTPEEAALVLTPESSRPYHPGYTANTWAQNRVDATVEAVENLSEMLPVLARAVANPGDIKRWVKKLRSASEALNQYLLSLEG